MDEQTYINTLREKSYAIRKVTFNTVSLCLTHKNCNSCPFYDESMTNKFKTHCFITLSSYYAMRLEQISDDLEKQHKENMRKIAADLDAQYKENHSK